jgi:hypothetical protein
MSIAVLFVFLFSFRTWKLHMLINNHILNLNPQRRLITFHPQGSIPKRNTRLYNRRFGNRTNWFEHFLLFFA